MVERTERRTNKKYKKKENKKYPYKNKRKERKRIIGGVLIVLIFLVGGLIFGFIVSPLNTQKYCSNVDVVYLKPSEMYLASDIAKGNRIAVIVFNEPGVSNRLIMETKFIKKCGDYFDYKEYLYTEIPEGNINAIINERR